MLEKESRYTKSF